MARNAELSKALEKVEKTKGLANDALENGVSSSQKQQIKQQLSLSKELIVKSATNNGVDSIDQEIAFDELDLLIGSMSGATAYKALNVATCLTKIERKTLERVFNILKDKLGNDAEPLFSEIIDEFQKEAKE